MVTEHAILRGVQRINNNSIRKNKKSNLKRIMKKDVYDRYFAYDSTVDRLYRYVKKDDVVLKYVLNKFNKRIITVYPVDFDEELSKRFNIKFRRRENEL